VEPHDFIPVAPRDFSVTRRSVSALAKASADTRFAFIHGLTPVAFCEGG